MADVLLLQPVLGYWDYIRSNPGLPLNIMYPAMYLLEDGYSVKIIDQRIDERWEKHLEKEIRKEPVIFGTSSVTGRQILYALKASKIVKENSDVPVVWGGVHPTLLPEQTLKNENIDFVVVGEGEVTLYNLVKTLEKDGNLKNVKGIGYKENGKIRINERAPLVDLNSLPPVPYHLVDVKRYIQRRYEKDILPIESSRGCPMRCTFCYQEGYWRRTWRAMRAERVLNEIKKLVDDYNVDHIFFFDDNFFVDRKRVFDIAKGIIDEKLDITWGVQTRVDVIDRLNHREFDFLLKSGYYELRIGVESGSQRILNMIKKDITIPQVIRVNRRLAKVDAHPTYNFMCGFPTETIEDLKKTSHLALKLIDENPKARITHITVYTPYPGSVLFEEVCKLGFRPPETLEGWATFEMDTPHMAWVPHENLKYIEGLFVSSLFVDMKSEDGISSDAVRTFATLYRPFARYRMKKMNFDFLIEKRLKDMYIQFREGMLPEL